MFAIMLFMIAIGRMDWNLLLEVDGNDYAQTA